MEIIDTAAGPCRLRRTRRKTLEISVMPDGRVELVAPTDATQNAIAAKVARRLRWITRQQRAFREMNAVRPEPRYCSGATCRYLGKQYRLRVRHGRPLGVKLIGGYFHVTASTGREAEVKELLTRWYRSKAGEQFAMRLTTWRDWCRVRHLPDPHLCLRAMPKRWGSAQRDGRIFLNPELVKAPSICIDYVIAHEICHLRHPRHNKAFFRLLDEVLPKWQVIKGRLERAER